MEKNNWLTKFLAVAGTVLVWLPILAPVVFSVVRLVQSGRFLFDYLMPAEFGVLVIAGAALLLWAALRAHAFVKPVVWGIVAGAIGLVLSQVFAVVTGLASGKAEAAGWRWMLVIGLLVVYILAVIFLGICGILLCVRLFRKS